LAALVLCSDPAFRIAPFDALPFAATTFGAHSLLFAIASALDLALAATALGLGHAAFTATAATLDALRTNFAAAATLRLGLTASTAALWFGLSAAAALSLSLTFSTAALVGFGGCRRGNR
jgi:hypothetical protein